MLTQANANKIPLKSKSVHVIVTSPPYKSKRDYGLPPQIYGGRADCEHKWGEELGTIRHSPQRDHNGRDFGDTRGNEASRNKMEASTGQFCRHCAAWRGSLGLEPTIELFIQHLIEVFRECWRVLRDDGVMFINIGDSYAGSTPGTTQMQPVTWSQNGKVKKAGMTRVGPVPGLKAKNLCLIPDHLRIALQKDGWIIRSKIIWHKPNPMPESASDRPTVDYEDVIMATKQGRYFWDQQAVREPHKEESLNRYKYGLKTTAPTDGFNMAGDKSGIFECDKMADFINPAGRNLRSVWAIPTESYSGAHFATFPKKLCIPPILGGTSAKGVCGACGAQWERIVKKKFVSDGPRREKLKRRKSRDEGWNGEVGFSQGSNQTKTTGWRPSCECNAPHRWDEISHLTDRGDFFACLDCDEKWYRANDEPIGCRRPAIVLDPFCGSGTVGQVAKQAGRQFVGLELSEEYLALAMVRAEKRTPQKLVDELPLFAGLKG